MRVIQTAFWTVIVLSGHVTYRRICAYVNDTTMAECAPTNDVSTVCQTRTCPLPDLQNMIFTLNSKVNIINGFYIQKYP